jgi:hydroxylysine kinase
MPVGAGSSSRPKATTTVGLDRRFSEPSPALDSAQTRRLARDLFGLDVAAIHELPGERDRNYRISDSEGRAFVLKVVHPAEPRAVTEFQTQALLHLGERDPALPVPRVIRPVRDELSRGLAELPDRPGTLVRCVTWLGGRPLAGSGLSATRWRELGALAARLDRALAGFSHPADDHELLWDLKRADQVVDLVDAIVDRGLRTLVAAVLDRFASDVKPRLTRLRDQVIHNDFNPHNVLTGAPATDRIAGIIDFGDVVRAPLVQELATAAAYQASAAGPLAPARHLTAGFQSVTPLDHEELGLLPDLIATRLGLSVTITSWQAARKPENAAYILRNQGTVRANLEHLVDRRGRPW